MESSVQNLTKKQKEDIRNIFLNFNLDIKGTQNLEFAINTGGGVCLREINPNNFESLIHKNLYVIGEVLDVNPRTNWFNITVCYSSAMSVTDDINK